MQDWYMCEQMELPNTHTSTRSGRGVPLGTSLYPPPVPIRSACARTHVVEGVSLAAREIVIVRVRRESRKSQCKHNAPSNDIRRPHPEGG